jgi:sporulation-control protein spo0M
MVLEELKAKAGFGGAKLKIHIPKDRYSTDETLRGEIILSGGKVIQEIKVLSISLIREWSWESYSTGMDMDFTPGIPRAPYSTNSVSVQAQYELDSDKGCDEVLNIELGEDIEISPEEERKFSFEIDLSTIQREKGVNEKWKLKTRADIPFAKDAIASREIKIEKKKKH